MGYSTPARSRHAVWEATSQVLPCGRGGADGALTPTRNRPSCTPTQRRQGRECVPCDYGAVRTCACQGPSRKTHREALLQTALNLTVGANSTTSSDRSIDRSRFP
jgi:hypothetical protein